MKKKFLIITSQIEKTASWAEREGYVQEFARNLQEIVDDIDVSYTTYQDLVYRVVKGEYSVYDARNKFDLKSVDLVHFKNWTYEYEEAALLAFYLKENQVSFYNSEVGIKSASGKLAQMFYLAAEKIPVPDTYFAHRKALKKLFESGEVPEGFSYPLIMKAENGSRGDDNHLIHDADKALEVLEETSFAATEFILQSFVPNDGDLRLLFMGLTMQPLIFRRTAVSGSHLNNTSKGGSGELIDIKKLPTEYIRISRRAAEVLGREIGGVDVIVHKHTNKAYILEVNGTPAIANGYATDEKVAMFAEFLQQSFEVMEEE